MDARESIAAIVALGALALALPFFVPQDFVFTGDAWLLLVVGTVYVASGAVAWLSVAHDVDSFAVAFAPAVVGPAVVLFDFVGLDPAGVVAALTQPALLSALAVVAGVGLAFPLGVARRPRRQWAVVVLLVLAAVPLVLTALSALSPGPPEDRDLLVLIGMVVLAVVPLLAIPPYALGRVLRRRAGDASASPYPPLVAAAVPYLLALAGTAAAPYFVGGTVFGIWILVVPLAVVLAILGQLVRVRAGQT